MAVAGAGIYGAAIAVRLANAGPRVRLFDPLGVMRAHGLPLRSCQPAWYEVSEQVYDPNLLRGMFPFPRIQVAEKIRVELPRSLRRVALVVLDGQFRALDPNGGSELSLFGSARNSNHWSSRDPRDAAPAARQAVYRGSRFTLRVAENETAEIHVFSAKVVGAVKAARLVAARIARGG